MLDWKKLVADWEEIWTGRSVINKDLRIIYYDDGLRISSDGYTQSKRVDSVNFQNGYWLYQMEAFDLTKIPDPRVLILGFGGGTMATLFKQRYANIKIDGVEIDPKMIELAKRFLDLDETGINIVIDDALSFIRKTNKKYHYICVDLYIGDKTPAEIETRAFYQTVNKLLHPGGAVSVNRIYEKEGWTSMFNSNQFKGKNYQRYLKLLKGIYPKVRVTEVPNQWVSKNFIFIGETNG